MTPNKLARFASQFFRSASELLDMSTVTEAEQNVVVPKSAEDLRHRGGLVVPDNGSLMDAWSQVVGQGKNDLSGELPKPEARAKRVPLPMCTDVKVKPGRDSSVQITSRPQATAYRVEFLMIENASDWMINDIKVGNKSQFAQSGDVPGACFAAGSPGTEVCFDMLETAMDFVIIATYVGKNKEGAEFQCSVMGTEVTRQF